MMPKLPEPLLEQRMELIIMWSVREKRTGRFILKLPQLGKSPIYGNPGAGSKPNTGREQ